MRTPTCGPELTKAQLLALIRGMSDTELARQSTHLRHMQSAAQRRADWVEREMRRRKKVAR